MSDKEIKDLTSEIKSLTKENSELKSQLETMQTETIAFKKAMDEKIAALGGQIAPDKVIITHEGKSYELKGKSIMIPEVGRVDIEKLKTDTNTIKLIVEKYPLLLVEIK